MTQQLKWRQFLVPVDAMSADEARAFTKKHNEDAFLLLDVREAAEYEAGHIPGAKHIPLSQLMERLAECNTDKPIGIYCAIGGRSRMAAQLLKGQGLTDVFYIKGGMAAWKGIAAVGPSQQGLEFFTGNENAKEIIVWAYGMETGLAHFYRTVGVETPNRDVATVCEKLAKIEDRHKEKLFMIYKELDPGVTDKKAFEVMIANTVMEGGTTTDEFLQSNRSALDTAPKIIDLAMTIETQALDLYLRYWQKTNNSKTKETVLGIAQEEKAHLAVLGRLMDQIASQGNLMDQMV